MKRSRPAFWILDYRSARIRLEINNAWKYLLMQRMVYFEDDPCTGFPIAMVKVWSDVFWARTRATPYKTTCIAYYLDKYATPRNNRLSRCSVSQLNREDFDYSVYLAAYLFKCYYIRFETWCSTSYATYTYISKQTSK